MRLAVGFAIVLTLIAGGVALRPTTREHTDASVQVRVDSLPRIAFRLPAGIDWPTPEGAQTPPPIDRHRPITLHVVSTLRPAEGRKRAVWPGIAWIGQDATRLHLLVDGKDASALRFAALLARRRIDARLGRITNAVLRRNTKVESVLKRFPPDYPRTQEDRTQEDRTRARIVAESRTLHALGLKEGLFFIEAEGRLFAWTPVFFSGGIDTTLFDDLQNPRIEIR